jgi:ferredoxin
MYKMGHIISGRRLVYVEDGQPIKDACESLGVQFGCQNGFCRTCEIDVIEGQDNLSILSENEEFIGLIKERRLACQCRLLQGNVTIRFG